MKKITLMHMNIFEKTTDSTTKVGSSIHEGAGVEKKIANAREELEKVINSVPVEEFIELDDETVEILLGEMHTNLKELIEKAKGKSQTTH